MKKFKEVRDMEKETKSKAKKNPKTTFIRCMSFFLAAIMVLGVLAAFLNM